MSRRKRQLLAMLVTSILALAGAAHGRAVLFEEAETGYTCPVTGEKLPCPKCCPKNPQQ